MSVLSIFKLLLSAAPAVRGVVVSLLQAFHAKDEAAVRKATEAALVLAFQLRNTRTK